MGVAGTSIAGTELAGKECSICQTAIVTGEKVVQCPDCGLPFHDECWTENRGCSAYGCSSAPPTVKADGGSVLTSTVWGGEKKCPACARTIKAEALKCRFCGATFETRELITTEQYTRREYDGQEYLSARNKIVLFFLISISGCLSVVGAIILGILIFAGEVWGLKYKRLPGALRGLSVAGFAIACLLLLVLVLLIAMDSGPERRR
jgi:ssDNA-binding Zn-finger/Zn-ribbon topoisomerase 1